MNAPGFILNPSQDQWHAEIKLGFTRVGSGTVLSERQHRGPLRVQKALYPEGESVCQAILLHPPSGIAGGDQLQISASVGPQAHAQITTPGAGKWYRSAGEEAAQNIDFTVAPGGLLEWLPQETIVFDGARSRMKTFVQMAADSRYLGWEILCLGRSAAGERFTYGNIALLTRIECHGQPVWLERGHIAGSDPLLDSITGWAGGTVCGTLLATLQPGDEVAPLLEACRAIHPLDAAENALTAFPGLLVARYLGHNSEAARNWFIALWQILRPALLGRAAVPPRIWNT
ncbi:MAG: urease accessory protein UreD [Betaproteobacteria bacterium]